MSDQCPDCGAGEPCERCEFAARFAVHLADPHRAANFLDGDLPCSVSGLWIEEHGPLVDGQSVCTRGDA